MLHSIYTSHRQQQFQRDRNLLYVIIGSKVRPFQEGDNPCPVPNVYSILECLDDIFPEHNPFLVVGLEMTVDVKGIIWANG